MIQRKPNQDTLKVSYATRIEFDAFAMVLNMKQANAVSVLLKRKVDKNLIFEMATSTRTIHINDIELEIFRKLKKQFKIASTDELVWRLLHSEQEKSEIEEHIQYAMLSIQVNRQTNKPTQNTMKCLPIYLSEATYERLLRKQIDDKKVQMDAPTHEMIQKLLNESTLDYTISYKLGRNSKKIDVRLPIPKQMFSELKVLCKENKIHNDELIWRLIHNYSR